MDTLPTHRLHRTPVKEKRSLKHVLTTFLFFSSYSSLLQTTNSNFTPTKITGEICAVVVKALGIYPKNAAQHAEDHTMLEKEEM